MKKVFLVNVLIFLSLKIFSQCSDSVVVRTTQNSYNTGQWNNLRQIIDTFNSAGYHSAYLYRSWNSSLAIWVPMYYSSMTHDAQGHLTDSVVQMNSPLVNKYKFQYAYDVNGLRTSDTVWTWNGASWQYGYCYSPTYCNPSLTEHYYDVYNHDSLDIAYMYNNGWIVKSRTLSSVDSTGLNSDIIIQLYDSLTGTWKNSQHEVLTYNTKGQITYNLIQYWSMSLSVWSNDYQYSTVSDSIGNIIFSESVSGYDSTISSGWFYHDNDELTYDSLNQLILEHVNHLHHSGSDGTTDVSYQFDIAGRLIYSEYTHETELNYTHQRTFYHYTNSVASFAGGSQSACSGDILQLTGAGFGGCGNLHYQWGPAENFNDSSLINPFVSLAQSAWVYLTVSDDSGNVSVDSAYIDIREHHPLTLTSNPALPILCNGSSIQLSADTTGSNVNFWMLQQNGINVQSSYNSLTWNIDSAAIYSLTTYTRNSCSDISGSILVTNAEPVSFTATTIDATCTGCTDGIISLSTTGGTLPLSYSWTPLNGVLNGDSIINLPAGQYIVCADDAIQCYNSCDTLNVLEPPSGITNSSSKTEIKFYPQPVYNSGILYINTTANNLLLILTDTNGKMISRTAVHNGTNNFNRGELKSGMYFYFIVSEQKTIGSGKVVIAD